MQTTNNFDLKIYEGDDLFNPLTVENENMVTIDETMKEVSDNSITTANHIKSNTVHALTRVNGDARMFTFKATSNYELGDSFTVDGVSVTALAVDGGAVPGGAFVIGSVVLCSLVGQLLTVYSAGGAEADDSRKLGGQLPAYYAKQTDMDSVTQLAQNASSLAQQNQQNLNNITGKLASMTTPNYVINERSVSVNPSNDKYTNIEEDGLYTISTGIASTNTVTSAALANIEVYPDSGRSEVIFKQGSSLSAKTYNSACVSLTVPLKAGNVVRTNFWAGNASSPATGFRQIIKLY